MATLKHLTNLFYELGVLKLTQRSGWTRVGIKHPESVAEHVMRATVIGMVLAELEGANVERVAAILAVHDIAEARIGDQNKIAAHYWDQRPAEDKAFEDQIANLPAALQQRFAQYRHEFEERNTLDGIVARDADWLECALTTREYIESGGYPALRDWITNIRIALETKSAQKLLSEIEKSSPTDWWKGLKKMTYANLKRGISRFLSEDCLSEASLRAKKSRFPSGTEVVLEKGE